MSVASRLRKPGNPVPIVIGIVVFVLLVQAIGAAIVAVQAERDAQDASEDIARIVADSYAERGSVLTRPAASITREIAEDVATGELQLGDTRAAAAVLYDYVRGHPPFGSVTIIADDGAWLRLWRTQSGFATQYVTAAGEVEQVAFTDSFLLALNQPVPQVPAGAMGWADAAAQGTAGEPQWFHVEHPAGGPSEAVVAVTESGWAGDVTVAIGVSIRAINDRLAGGTEGDIASAFIISPEGAVIAGPAGEEPLQIGLHKSGAGRVGTDGDITVYERSLGAGTGDSPMWTVHVEVSGEETVPAVAAFPRTMAIYMGVVIAVAALAALLLWQMRRPLWDMAVRARSDSLTGLANRHEFDRRGRTMLDAAQRRGAHVAVVIIDLDHFKRVNDDISHEAGDTVLRAVAHALQLHTGPRDIVARIGGDEFAVVRWLQPDEDVDDVVAQLRDEVEADMRAVTGYADEVGISAGYASTRTTQSYKVHRLLAVADEALVEGRRVQKGETYAAVPADVAGARS